MWVTMIISGIWHGAAFTFIIWGLIHAFFLSLERILGGRLIKLHSSILYVFTMLQVLTAWVFFRATTVSEAISIISKSFNFSENAMYWNEFENAYYFIFIAVFFEFLYFLTLKIKIVNVFYKTSVVQILEISFLIVAILFFRGPEQAFIYFQF